MKKVMSFLGVALVSACTTTPSKEVLLTVVHQSNQCGISAAGLTQITKDHRLLGQTREAIPPELQPTPEPTTNTPEDQRLFLVTMGEQRSGGYHLNLTQTVSLVESNTLRLPVEFQVPAPGSMQTTQITTPCLIIAATPGDYHRAEVEGQPSWQVQIQDFP